MINIRTKNWHKFGIFPVEEHRSWVKQQLEDTRCIIWSDRDSDLHQCSSCVPTMGTISQNLHSYLCETLLLLFLCFWWTGPLNHIISGICNFMTEKSEWCEALFKRENSPKASSPPCRYSTARWPLSENEQIQWVSEHKEKLHWSLEAPPFCGEGFRVASSFTNSSLNLRVTPWMHWASRTAEIWAWRKTWGGFFL